MQKRTRPFFLPFPNPTPAQRKPRADLTRLPVGLDARAISLREGLRAGLAVAALVAAAYAFHAPILLECGLGALLTCFGDAGGPVRRRIPALLAFAVFGAVLTAGMGLARQFGFLALPLASFGIFCCGFARIYSQNAWQAGNLLSVVLVLALDHRFPTLRAALPLSLAFLGGALWALLMTMAIWRLHPNHPARQAVAHIYTALGALCAGLARRAEDGGGVADWDALARSHRRAVRDRIEEARTAIGDRLRAGGTHSRPAAQALLRMEAADQIFALLIALTDQAQADQAQAGGGPAAGAELRAYAATLAALLRDIAPAIEADADAALPGLTGRLAALPEPSGAAARRLTQALGERLMAALLLTGTHEVALPAAPSPPWSDRILSPIRANLTWRSTALRHAARAATIATIGFAITFAHPTSTQHWLTITLVLTLQPYYAATLQRALERIGGTVAGGLLAAAITLVCRSPAAIALATLPLSVAALAVRGVNYGVYVSLLTPLIVLLAELALPAGGLAIAEMRALYTLIGGLLAVAGALLLWPSWEPDRLRQELRATIAAHAAYARAAMDFLLGAGPAASIDRARRNAGMASNNLEASLNRALLEPRRDRARLQQALVVDAALRRLAGRLLALQFGPHPQGDASVPEWHDWVREATARLEQDPCPALPDRPMAVPADPALAEALARIARQIELCAGALRRRPAEAEVRPAAPRPASAGPSLPPSPR